MQAVMKIDAESDVDVLARVAAGEKSAMRVLHDRYADPLFQFIRSRSKDPSEAADVLQDTLRDVWRTAGKFEGRSTVKTWLYSIARNKMADRYRKTKRTVLAEPDETIPDDRPNPETVASAADDAARVRSCLSKLSPHHRTAIHLAFYQDMTYGEIAVIENVPEGTIKTRIYHAKRLLMRCLARAEQR